MARGPKKHLKRLHAPKHWMLDKLGGTWAPRPSTGPHKMRECIPLVILLRNRLKYALTSKEVLKIVMKKHIQVDHKVRTDMNFPAGFMDIISIPALKDNYRMLYDSKGRFYLHKVDEKEAAFKLCRVLKVAKASKASIGRNPLATGQAAAIPYIVTHDGRTIRYIDPRIKINDTVKIDIKTGKVVDFVKFDVGNVCMVTRGHNVGRVGIMTHKEKHPGSFDIVHLKDKNGHQFATRLSNVFVIGKGDHPLVTLGKRQGLKLSIEEERDIRTNKKDKKH